MISPGFKNSEDVSLEMSWMMSSNILLSAMEEGVCSSQQ